VAKLVAARKELMAAWVPGAMAAAQALPGEGPGKWAVCYDRDQYVKSAVNASCDCSAPQARNQTTPHSNHIHS